MLQGYGIKHMFSIPYYPQGNGLAESTNKTLIRILSRTVHDNPRSWHEKLPVEIWAYWAFPRTSTGVSPYSLVYGADAILPVEIKIQSARVSIASGVQWDATEASLSRIADLDMVEARRAKIEEHLAVYKQRFSRVYNKTLGQEFSKLGT
ncbi:uncharacterized protein LOC113350856 [Papaver somniferum]|uniref:uncharacterized protein LOC113350856 n=1 Tax=Papaver somniferum TaxID=3469 RepID=UPI000E7029D8|nr:uncharacterized protein LOC113350856 [Papaver somniferum]